MLAGWLYPEGMRLFGIHILHEGLVVTAVHEPMLGFLIWNSAPN